MSGPVQRVLLSLSHLILETSLGSQECSYPHFTDGETEAPCCCFTRVSYFVTETGLKPKFTPQSYAIYHWYPLPSCCTASIRGQKKDEGMMAVKKMRLRWSFTPGHTRFLLGLVIFPAPYTHPQVLLLMDLSGFPSLLRPRVPPLHSDLLLEILASGCDPAVVFRIEKNVNLPCLFLASFLLMQICSLEY